VSDNPTMRDQYEELLTCAQRNWRRALDADVTPDERSHAMAHACSYFSSAFLLSAFLKRDEDAALEASAELHEILSDGGAPGEHIWQMLSSLGMDPDTVEPIITTPQSPAEPEPVTSGV
jgi:hypothetical protein